MKEKYSLFLFYLMRYIVRLKISFAALMPLSLTVPKGLTTCSPAFIRYAPHPEGRAPHLASSPISQASCTPPGSQPKRFHFPASSQRYSKQPITFSRQEPACHHNPLLLQSLPPTDPACSLYA